MNDDRHESPHLAVGTPTGGVDVLGRPLFVGDVVMAVQEMVPLYTIAAATPVLDPRYPPGSTHVVLQSQIDPVTAPGKNRIPVIKISGGPTVRPGTAPNGAQGPRLVSES
jgi:hypothetical protein